MGIDKNNNYVGGLRGSFLGQRATQTRIRSMNSPEKDKLKEELQASNANEKEAGEAALMEEMLSRLDPRNL